MCVEFWPYLAQSESLSGLQKATFQLYSLDFFPPLETHDNSVEDMNHRINGPCCKSLPISHHLYSGSIGLDSVPKQYRGKGLFVGACCEARFVTDDGSLQAASCQWTQAAAHCDLVDGAPELVVRTRESNWTLKVLKDVRKRIAQCAYT